VDIEAAAAAATAAHEVNLAADIVMELEYGLDFDHEEFRWFMARG
jgi:hypothetical protein